MSKTFSVVVTTINTPTLLANYKEFADKHDLDMNIIVVPDNKTPKEAKGFVEGLGGEYLERNILGYQNDDAKRMEGILRAIERGDDYVILLDDDNLLNGDIRAFNRVGEDIEANTFYSDNGWINPCIAMDKPHIVHRGFPYSKIGGDVDMRTETHKVVVNAGLWTNSADVDAIFHLLHDTNTQKLRCEFALGRDQFAPFNSQNTAILGETLPGYFFRPKQEGEVTRYSDIFASYFYEKIAHRLGGTVLYGNPLSLHYRNPHNLLDEVLQETKELIWIEDIVPSLEEMELKKESWGDCLYEILEKLEPERETTKDFISFYKSKAGEWLKAIKNI